MTSLTGVKVEVKVSDGAIKSGGLLSANYLIFQIKTKGILSWEVTRKESDFYFLRKTLIR